MNVQHYIVSGDMSADIVGPWIDLEGLLGIGFQAVWLGASGSAIGVFEFDISCDDDARHGLSVVLGATKLTLVAAMTVAGASPASNDSNFFFDFTSGTAGNFRPNAKWMRMRYKRTSGTGTLNAGVSGIGR